jgi:FixJ family two-component response regulator
MERDRLLEWTRRHKSAQALALRARIVLTAAEGYTNRTVAQQLRITGQTVGKWRSRLVCGWRVCWMNRDPERRDRLETSKWRP